VTDKQTIRKKTEYKSQKNKHLNTIQIKENKQINIQQKQNSPGSVASYDTRPGNLVVLFCNGPEHHKGILLDIGAKLLTTHGMFSVRWTFHHSTAVPLMNVAMQNADGLPHVSHPTTSDASASLLSAANVPLARLSANCVRWRQTDMPDVIAGRNRFAAAVRHRQPIPTKQLASTSSEINESAQHIECDMRLMYHRFFPFDMISK